MVATTIGRSEHWFTLLNGELVYYVLAIPILVSKAL